MIFCCALFEKEKHLDGHLVCRLGKAIIMHARGHNTLLLAH